MGTSSCAGSRRTSARDIPRSCWSPAATRTAIGSGASGRALAVDRVLGVEALEEEVEAGDADAAHSDLERRCLRRGDDVVPVLDVVKIVDSLVHRAPSETVDASAVAKEGEG